MRIELDANSLGYGCKGLETGVLGFQSSPTDAESQPSQVFLEIYEGQLRVHVWDGLSQDPTTTVIPVQTATKPLM
jgi:hypothetical protein